MIEVKNLVKFYPNPVGLDVEEIKSKLFGEEARKIENQINSLILEGDAVVKIALQDGGLVVGVETEDIELKKKIRDSIRT